MWVRVISRFQLRHNREHCFVPIYFLLISLTSYQDSRHASFKCEWNALPNWCCRIIVSTWWCLSLSFSFVLSTYSHILATTTANLQLPPVQPSAQRWSTWRNTNNSVPNVPTTAALRAGWRCNHQADPTITNANPTITEQCINNNEMVNLMPIPESKSTRSGENRLLFMLLSTCDPLKLFKQTLSQQLYLLAMQIRSQMRLVQLTIVRSSCILIYLGLISSLSQPSDATPSNGWRTFSFSKPTILTKQQPSQTTWIAQGGSSSHSTFTSRKSQRELSKGHLAVLCEQ